MTTGVAGVTGGWATMGVGVVKTALGAACSAVIAMTVRGLGTGRSRRELLATGGGEGRIFAGSTTGAGAACSIFSVALSGGVAFSMPLTIVIG